MLSKLALPYHIDDGLVEEVLTVAWQHLQDGSRTLDDFDVRVWSEDDLKDIIGKKP